MSAADRSRRPTLCQSRFIPHRIPGLAEVITKAEQQQAAIPQLREAVAAIAVLVAPFAEEFLFRGLLYRALDRSSSAR